MINEFSFTINYIHHRDILKQEIRFGKGLNVIYGESGVGKSELAYLISDEKDEKLTRFKLTNKSIRSDIYIIQQNPDLQIFGNSILNEIAFNLECKYQSSDEINKKLEAIIKKLFFKVELSRHPTTLSGGEKELLNISTTHSLDPNVIILDDAMSFLSKNMKSEVVKSFENSGVIVLWFTSEKNDLQYSNLKWEMTENCIRSIESIQDFEYDKSNIKKGEIDLQISKLHFAYNSNVIFSDLKISTEVFRCLGITGENGNGKSTLALLLLNLEKPSSGNIKLTNNNNDISIGFLDQFPERLVGINTIEDFVNKLVFSKILNESRKSIIINELKESNIKWNIIKTIPGNRLSWTLLRIILITILANCNYDLLILDEPTFGMGQNQINNLRSYLIRYLDKKHLILISHDNIFLDSICDKTLQL